MLVIDEFFSIYFSLEIVLRKFIKNAEKERGREREKNLIANYKLVAGCKEKCGND